MDIARAPHPFGAKRGGINVFITHFPPTQPSTHYLRPACALELVSQLCGSHQRGPTPMAFADGDLLTGAGYSIYSTVIPAPPPPPVQFAQLDAAAQTPLCFVIHANAYFASGSTILRVIVWTSRTPSSSLSPINACATLPSVRSASELIAGRSLTFGSVRDGGHTSP